VSVFGELEVVNAMGLRIFRKEISAAQAQASLDDFEKDLRAKVFQLKPLPDQVFERARQLSRQTTAKLGTRTADLLHVATALELSADYLYIRPAAAEARSDRPPQAELRRRPVQSL
jgi:hypothetical protein